MLPKGFEVAACPALVDAKNWFKALQMGTTGARQ